MTWPAPGQPAQSASAVVVPYRPAELSSTIPCSALRSGSRGGQSVDVLATGVGDEGLIVIADPGGITVRLDGRTVTLPTPSATAACRVEISAGDGGVTVVSWDGQRTELAEQPVPQVFGFRTGLAPDDAAGMSTSVVLRDPFGTSPGPLKIALIAAQLAAVGAALTLLSRTSRGWWRQVRWRQVRWRQVRWRQVRWRQVWWVDVAIAATFAGWAVIGPLAVDDGWATMIARTFADTGTPGNYYRWWNAAEVPFALDQQLLAPLTQISLAPLWLRLPSTVLAIATWFVLSRGVLGAALPGVAGTARIRMLAATTLAVTWLPFNLGTRPEAYVALGVTTVLALAMRSRSASGLGWLVLAAALTVPISPNSILVAAPVVVFAPRLLGVLRSASPTRLHLLTNIALLCCVGAVALTVIFGDQSLDALSIATDWHDYFGPSLPWYSEGVRYEYLLQPDQQGSFGKRLPVLLSLAMLPIVGALASRRVPGDPVGRAAARLVAVVGLAVLLFAVSPSKWSYHFGGAAGIFAALLTVGIVLVVRRAAEPNRQRVIVGVGGSVVLALAVGLAFDGPNAWWQPAVYDVPWADGPPVPLNQPLLWLGGLALVSVTLIIVGRSRLTPGRVLVAGPAMLAGGAVAIVLMLMIGSFVAAPIRQWSGSLAVGNLERLDATRFCGLADHVELLPDGPVLTATAEPGGRLAGFDIAGGYPPTAPPPEPPGTGASAYTWGSRGSGSTATPNSAMTSPWFVLPPQGPDGGVALSVSGRTDGGNELTFEFGRAAGPTVDLLGAGTPVDRPAADEDPVHPLWRSIGVDANVIPRGSDRVRIRAAADVAARTDGYDWLAFTGPRLRSVVPLSPFLAANAPVLVAWPQAFLFPCLRAVPTVSGGLAETPRVVIESPRPWLRDDRARSIGGTFHELTLFGDLREIPSRLVGAPGVDWGSVFVSADRAARDGYLRAEHRDLVSGAGGTPHRRPER